MAQRNVALQIQLKNAKSISDLETVIKDINKELKSVDVNSEAFKELSDTAKQATESLNDVKDSLKSISSEKQIDSVAKLGGALAAGLSIATVAASHFGQQTQESIQKAIRVATELNTVVNSIKPIMEGLSATNRKAFLEWVNGFKNSGIAATLFGTTTRAALTATGIGLLVVALGTVVAYFDEITDAVGLTNHALDDSIKKQEKLIIQSNELNSSIEKRLEFELALAKARGESAVEIASQEVTLAQQRLDAIDQEIQQYNEILNQKNKALKLQQSDLDHEKELRAIQEQRFNELQIARAVEAKAIKDANDKEAKDAKALADKRKSDLEKAYKEELDRIEKLKQARLAAIREQIELELRLEKPWTDAIEKSFKRITDKTSESFKATQRHLDDLTEQVNEGIDFDKLKEKFDEIRPFVDVALRGINDVSNALTQGIQRQYDQLSLQLQQVNADYQTSTELRKSYEQELSQATGLQREQLLAALDEERKKEQQLADTRKKIVAEQIKAQNKQQDIEWKNSILNSVVQGALAVVESLPNIPLSIAVGVLSALETGIITANKPQPVPTPAATGGFTGSGGAIDATGEKQAGIYQLHANEWIAPRWMVEDKLTGNIISQLEAYRVGNMAVGGFPDPPSIPQQTTFNFTPEQMKSIIESAKIFVSAQEIRDVETNVQVIESRASIAA